MKEIKFGTDGWRGIIADDFIFGNVRIVAQAVADYLNNKGMGSLGIVVGYDNRFLSDRFANVVADVFVGNGIKVYLAEAPLPTPVTAFAVLEHGAAGAVMLTASHNPPEYNGFKFIPEYAGPALPEITQAIEQNVVRLVNAPELVFGAGLEMASELAVGPAAVAERVYIDPRPAYFAQLKKLVDMDALSRAHLMVVVDAMHGSGMGYPEVLLQQAGSQVHPYRCSRDPLFGGSLPEPTAKLLASACQLVKDEGANLGLALDGDADRFGIIDAGGVYITPNQFIPLLYHHLITVKGMMGPVTRTVATTHMLDRIAAQHGQAVYETAVGFKYIGQNLLEKGCVLGGEESGGLSIKGHIPEKDGVLAGLLAAEMVAVHGKSLSALAAEVAEIYGVQLYSERLDVHTMAEQKPRVLEKIAHFAPAELAGEPVIERITLDGLKLVLQSGEWVLVRASGTEPLFRIYAESDRPERINEIHRAFSEQVGL